MEVIIIKTFFSHYPIICANFRGFTPMLLIPTLLPADTSTGQQEETSERYYNMDRQSSEGLFSHRGRCSTI